MSLNTLSQTLLQVARAAVPRRFRPKLYIVSLVRERTSAVVQQGPFIGMRFEPNAANLPHILGTYERELWPAIDDIRHLPPMNIVVMGAAEGFYAVGLARLLPRAKVIAFEMLEDFRLALRRVAELNGVQDRIDIRGKCEIADVTAVLSDPDASLVICDVEGYERALLDPERVPALRRCHVLVELHDFDEPDTSTLIRRRFTESHEIVEFHQTERTAADFPYLTPYLRILPKSYRAWAVNEGRSTEMTWFWMSPRST